MEDLGLGIQAVSGEEDLEDKGDNKADNLSKTSLMNLNNSLTWGKEEANKEGQVAVTNKKEEIL